MRYDKAESGRCSGGKSYVIDNREFLDEEYDYSDDDDMDDEYDPADDYSGSVDEYQEQDVPVVNDSYER